MIVGQHIQWNTICDAPNLHSILNKKLDDFIIATDPTYGTGELTYYYQVDYYNSDIIISVYQYVDGCFVKVTGCGYNNNRVQTVSLVTPTTEPQTETCCTQQAPVQCVPQQPTIPIPSATNDHTKLINKNADANFQHVTLAEKEKWNTETDVLGTVLTGLTEATTKVNLESTDTVLGAFGKIKKWFSSLKALAFLDTVDYTKNIDNIPTDLVQDANYVHTDNNYTNTDAQIVANTSGVNTGDQDLTPYLLADTDLQTADTPEDTSLFSFWKIGLGRVKIAFSELITKLGLYFQKISSVGGTSAPLYMSNSNSDVSGYKRLSPVIDVSETEVSIIATNSTVYGDAYLSDDPIGITEISAGPWAFDYWRKVSSVQQGSYKGLDVFMYDPINGTETILFSVESPSIEGTDFEERSLTSPKPLYIVDPTHRLGVRSKFRTTRHTATTLTYIIGNGRGWWMRTPLTVRHSELRGLEWLTSGHTGTANKVFGTDENGVAKEYKATIQSAISTSSGTIDLGINTITVLTTTLTNSHTIEVTPTAPTEFINSQIAQLDFTTGVTIPSITLTAPSGVTFKWRHTAITAWTASKTYTIQFVWISSTRCDIYYLIS